MMKKATGLNTPLGEGLCNFGKIFELIREKRYKGWITVEQNASDDLIGDRTWTECGKISRNFIKKGLGI